ncbi:MAG: DUF349 domain-containing protein [Bacteroidales bacterium]|nr:DUF349 domain-containing protein [Bacteroidales bacterium]
MSEDFVPEVNNTPDVEETKSPLKTIVENVSELASKASDIVGDAVAEVAEEVKDAFDDAVEAVKDVAGKAKDKVEDVLDGDGDDEKVEETVDLGSKTLAELSDMFDSLSQDENRMKRYKEAEAIKSAFYKRLSKEKAEAGLGSKVDEPSSREDVIEEVAPAPSTDEVKDNPFEAIETAFKGVYANYKKERAEYNRQQDAQREDNFVAKQAVIEDLKALVEKQEDVSSTFPAFRELQNRWREIGPVPATKFRDLNDTYQFYVEKFYDMVKINRDLRDLDFKKNLEAKQEFCEAAEKLAEDDNVVEAFRELQKLHEQWKEYGPVAKEYRDSIWDRFKAATAVINKKYQAYFEGQKEKQQENLEEKTKLCEQVEAIAEKEVKSSGEWNQLSSEIEEIQKKWRTIGFATKKENQKIYDRFRAACDKFFARKREYYSQFKDSMNENMEKKLSIIERVEALKDSKEWKKTTEAIIALQKEWKEIGAVPRKKSEQLWKRFRAACDEFFAERDKNAKPENDYYGNLKAKKALIEEINAYESKDAAADQAAAQEFAEKWRNIGFVPYKEKESIQKAYSDAMQAKFPDYSPRAGRGASRGPVASRKPVSEKDRLVQEYNKLQQDIVTYENNIGFFSASKNSEPLIKQMQERIEAAKKELKELEAKIIKEREGEEEK